MKTTPAIQTSRLRFYWRVLVAVVAAGLALRYTAFYGTSQGDRWILGRIFVVGMFVMICGFEGTERRRLRAHLKEHHWDKCLKLAVPHLFWPSSEWLYSTEDYNDPTLAAIKANYRGFFRWMIVAGLATVIMCAVWCA